MHKTRFAGLTAPEPGDDLTVDDSGFVTRNPDLIDRFVEIGAITHRHDAHPAMAAPVASASATVIPNGGFIPGNTDIYLCYSLIDQDGGETLASPIEIVNTGETFQSPTTPFGASADYTAGSLLADTYYYCLTLMDGVGSETMIGPQISVDIEPGSPTAQIHLAGLTADFAINDAVSWRLYKARSGQPFGFIATGTGNTFTDDGSLPTDAGSPPPALNRTNRRNSLVVNVPAGSGGVASGAAAFRLYASLDGSFTGNALLGEYGTASAGIDLTYTTLSLLTGQPLDQPTAIRGARQIDAELDLSHLFWRSPVASAAGLPTGNYGEVRLALDTGIPWYVSASAGATAPGGAGWSPLAEGISDALGGGSIRRVSASGDGFVNDPTSIVFAAGSAVSTPSVSVTDLGGGSAKVTYFIASGGGGGGSGSVGPQGPAGASGAPGPSMLPLSSAISWYEGATASAGAERVQLRGTSSGGTVALYHDDCNADHSADWTAYGGTSFSFTRQAGYLVAGAGGPAQYLAVHWSLVNEINMDGKFMRAKMKFLGAGGTDFQIKLNRASPASVDDSDSLQFGLPAGSQAAALVDQGGSTLGSTTALSPLLSTGDVFWMDLGRGIDGDANDTIRCKIWTTDPALGGSPAKNFAVTLVGTPLSYYGPGIANKPLVRLNNGGANDYHALDDIQIISSSALAYYLEGRVWDNAAGAWRSYKLLVP